MTADARPSVRWVGWAVDLALWILVATTTLLYSRAFDDNILVKAGVVAVGGGVLLLLGLAYLALQGRLAWLRLPVYPGAVAFALVGAVGALRAPSPGVVWESLLGYTALFGLFVITAHRCRRARSALSLVWALVAVQVVVGAVGVLQDMGLDPLASPAAAMPHSSSTWLMVMNAPPTRPRISRSVLRCTSVRRAMP